MKPADARSKNTFSATTNQLHRLRGGMAVLSGGNAGNLDDIGCAPVAKLRLPFHLPAPRVGDHDEFVIAAVMPAQAKAALVPDDSLIEAHLIVQPRRHLRETDIPAAPAAATAADAGRGLENPLRLGDEALDQRFPALGIVIQDGSGLFTVPPPFS